MAERRFLRFRRIVWISGLALLGAALFLCWLLLPWRRIDGVRVEATQVVATGGGRRIAVDFSTDDDLRNVLARYGAGFVTARLFSCDDDTRAVSVVVVQRGGHLVDEGRVRMLPGSQGRMRYRAMFDNRLSTMVDHRIVSTAALTVGQPLCFSLGGGGMFMSRIRADIAPLAPLRPRSF